MSNLIEDGTGRGYLAEVDMTNRLRVESIGIPERIEAVNNGDAYEIGAPPVTFTGTAETGLIYVQNNDPRDLIIERWEFSSAESTGGTSGVTLLRLYKDATGVTNSSPGGAVNSNFGSSKALAVDVEIGNGSTSAVSGGTLFGAAYIEIAKQSLFEGPWELPRGKAIALSVTPPTGNTSMPLGVRIITHLRREA